jgi:hypothetical protein
MLVLCIHTGLCGSEPRYVNNHYLCCRVQSGFGLMFAFYLIVCMGPPGLVLLTYVVQLASFYEAVELSFAVTG